jgi:LuxR family transcriptional regulator, maltose regulon positive regulatory protein
VEQGKAQPGQTQPAHLLLEYLERANLFLIPLDEERRWYRYHPLFADVLRSRLKQTEPMMAPELHRRASAWYEQHGLVVEAVQHALEAPDLELAARLIEQNGISIAIRGQVHLVLGWLNALPEVLVRSRARLCLYSAFMLMFTNQLEAARVRLLDAEACARADMPADQARIIQGGSLASARISLSSLATLRSVWRSRIRRWTSCQRRRYSCGLLPWWVRPTITW